MSLDTRTFDDLKVIVVPTDFTSATTGALRSAIQLARVFGAAIDVLHVNLDPTFVLPPPADVMSLPIDIDGVVVSVAERLDHVARNVRQAGIACTTSSEIGRTHVEIIDHARKVGAGMIVMGTHGRHGIGHFLMGSVAEKVVQYADCPVLIVPAAATGTPKAVTASFRGAVPATG